MSVFAWTLIFFPSKVSAITLSQIGSSDDSIRDMWQRIRDIFPLTELGASGLPYAVLQFSQFLLLMIGSVAVAVLIYAGITMIVSAGNDEKVGEAKKMMLYALLGVGLALVADIVVLYVEAMVRIAAGG